MGINDVTGDSIYVGASSSYDDNYDRIFKKGKYAVEATAVQPEPQAVGASTEDRTLSRHCNSGDCGRRNDGVLCEGFTSCRAN